MAGSTWNVPWADWLGWSFASPESLEAWENGPELRRASKEHMFCELVTSRWTFEDVVGILGKTD